MKNIQGLFLVGCSALALAGCGPSDISSPGTGGDVIINPSPTPTGGPGGGGDGSVTPAAATACAGVNSVLTNGGTISGPTGEWRICRVPNLLRSSLTLTKVPGVLYEIDGRVNVGCDGGFAAPTAGAPYTSTTVGCTSTALTQDTDVTLTIQPGVIVYANSGQSWIAVNRGNKINAAGSATAPIVFTSRDNVQGLNNDNSQGQWGGVVLMGRARVTDCNVGTVAANTCERDTEGSADLARFGGRDDTYNAGTMRYVQIRYSGYVLGKDKELQALTTEGTGSGTTLEYIQSHNSSDDGAEFFGGTVNLKHYIASGADDDSLDVDVGAQMNVQYAMLLQRPGRGDALMEIDSNNNETDIPRTNLTVANFIAVQSQVSPDNEGASGDGAAMLFRGNSDTRLVNGIVLTPNNECVRINNSGPSAANYATLTANSVVMQCNATKYLATGTANSVAAVQAIFTGNNNSDAFTPTVTSIYFNGTNENQVVAFDASTLNAAPSTFFNALSPNRIGAAWTGNDAWYTGWTCNSSTANFGSAGTSCTSLPTAGAVI